MKLLSTDAQQAIGTYLNEHARPLEQTRYGFYFGKRKGKHLVKALAPYHNEDGGFGQGLEPDIRLDASSVIATTLAFQTFREAEAHFAKKMVRAACEYLKQTYDADQQTWVNVPPEIADAPHAPWWVHQEAEGFAPNPTAEIVGYLYDYEKNFDEPPFDEAWRTNLTETVVSHLLEQDELEQHDLLCYLRLARTLDLPDGIRIEVRHKLDSILREAVTTDPDEWGDYTLTPLDVIEGPVDEFAYLFKDAVATQLDQVVTHLEAQHTIEPAWAWEGEAWETAKREWTGMLTLNRLIQLKRFGRLE